MLIQTAFTEEQSSKATGFDDDNKYLIFCSFQLSAVLFGPNNVFVLSLQLICTSEVQIFASVPWTHLISDDCVFLKNYVCLLKQGFLIDPF